MATAPPMGLRQTLPGCGFSFGVDGGATSGVTEIVNNSITSLALQQGLLQLATVTLTTANITGMNATPVTLLAAPGSGKSIVVDSCLFRFNAGATQFTGGGAVTIQYHGAGACLNTISAGTITSASSSDTYMVTGASNITATQNVAIEITNATAAFATGNGSATLFIWYTIN